MQDLRQHEPVQVTYTSLATTQLQRALARTLVSDASARTAMGSAARSAVEKLGWMAAIRRIRDQQYQRAIRTFRAHKRFCQQAYPPCMCMLRLILPKLFAQATSARSGLVSLPKVQLCCTRLAVTSSMRACCSWCRFRWLAIAVFVTRLWRGSLAATVFATNWLVWKLDYARNYRYGACCVGPGGSGVSHVVLALRSCMYLCCRNELVKVISSPGALQLLIGPGHAC